MAEAAYTLPPDDPCHSTWEAFKYVLGFVDASWQARLYPLYRECHLSGGRYDQKIMA